MGFDRCIAHLYLVGFMVDNPITRLFLDEQVDNARDQRARFILTIDRNFIK